MFDVRNFFLNFFENRKNFVGVDQKTSSRYLIKCIEKNSNKLIMFSRDNEKQYTYSLTSNILMDHKYVYTTFLNVKNDTLLKELQEYLIIINNN